MPASIFEKVVREEGQQLLGWREVPVDASKCGPLARAVDAGDPPGLRRRAAARRRRPAALERKLYVDPQARRAAACATSGHAATRERFYVPSLSSRTIVYKGLLLPDQIPQFYLDLRRPAIRVARSRWCTSASAPTRFPSWDLAHPFRFLAHNGEINTLRGNVNWMHAREAMFASPLFGDDIEKICPDHRRRAAATRRMFDNALELLLLDRPLAAARHDDDDPRGVAEPRDA